MTFAGILCVPGIGLGQQQKTVNVREAELWWRFCQFRLTLEETGSRRGRCFKWKLGYHVKESTRKIGLKNKEFKFL